MRAAAEATQASDDGRGCASSVKRIGIEGIGVRPDFRHVVARTAD